MPFFKKTPEKLGAKLINALRSQYFNPQRILTLIEQGADLQVQSAQGISPLMYAAMQGRYEVAAQLLSRGADVNETGKKENKWFPLLFAAGWNKETLAELLLDHDADIEKQDETGLTALINAAKCGHKDMVSLLLERGADPVTEDHNGVTARMHAQVKGHKKVSDILQVAEDKARGLLPDEAPKPVDRDEFNALAARIRHMEETLESIADAVVPHHMDKPAVLPRRTPPSSHP